MYVTQGDASLIVLIKIIYTYIEDNNTVKIFYDMRS